MEHLRKVVHTLGKLDYLRTYRGKTGGMELNKNPEDINLADVYRELEMVEESVIDCTKLECLLNTECKLKSILQDGENAFIAELEKHTVRDLIDNMPTKILLSKIS